MVKAFYFIFFLLIGRLKSSYTPCSINSPTSMIATESFIDFFPGGFFDLIATSDNGVVLSSLDPQGNVRTIKLNQEGKMEWTNIFKIVGFQLGFGMNLIEDDRDPANKLILFLGMYSTTSNSVCFLAACDLATCSDIKLKNPVGLSGNYLAIYIKGFLKVPSTNKIYSFGYVQSYSYEYRIILAEYDSIGFTLNEITGTSFSQIITENLSRPYIFLTPIQTILLTYNIYFKSSASMMHYYYEFDISDFPLSPKNQNSYRKSSSSSDEIVSPVYISGKLYIIIRDYFYKVNSNFGGVVNIPGPFPLSATIASNNNLYGILSTQKGYMGGALIKFNEANSCFFDFSSESTIYNFHFEKNIQSFSKTFYWTAGFYFDTTSQKIGILKIEDTILKTCSSGLVAFKNTDCLTLLTSGCSTGCTSKCYIPNNFNACAASSGKYLIWNSVRPITDGYLYTESGTAPVKTTDCSSLCGGMCQEANNPNKCAYYCSAIIEGIDDSLAGTGVCKCIAGYSIGVSIPICVITSGCSNLCYFQECNAAGFCTKCKQIPNMKEKKIGNFYQCTCNLVVDMQGKKSCILTSTKCHTFCSGSCINENDASSCYGCNKLNSFLVEQKINDISKCSCSIPRVEANGLCALTTDCSNFCNGVCMIAHDNTKCIGTCAPGFPASKIKNNGDGTITCVDIKVSLKFKANDIILDRCKGAEFVATVSPEEYAPIVWYTWMAKYDNPLTIPFAFTSELAKTITKTSSSLTIPGNALFPGMNLIVAITVLDPALMETASSSYTLAIPLSQIIYCGPCQLNDKDSCASLNGICWSDYKILTETPKNDSNCLFRMAILCYNIWKANGFNTDDPQCKQYQQIYNITLMSKKNTFNSVSHVHSGVAIINILFDNDANPKTAHDCSSILTADSYRALGFSALCKWKTRGDYEIGYIPDKEYIRSISIKGGNIFTNYSYSMEPMDEFKINIPDPLIIYNFELVLPKIISPAAPALLKAKGFPGKPVIWSYAWILSYSSGNCTSNQAAAANNYFSSLHNFDCSHEVIIIPAKLLYPNSILKIIINAKHQYSSTVYVEEASIAVTDETYSYEVNTKLPINTCLYGKNKNNIEISIFSSNLFQRAVQSLISSQSVDYLLNNDSTFFAYEVRSGDIPSNMIIRGTNEIAIERILNTQYKYLKLLSLSAYSNFKYYTYYNITQIIQSKLIGQNFRQISSSSLTVYLEKRAPVCKITIPGFFIDPSLVNIFSSKNSILDFSDGDEILYYWNCESCLSLLSNFPCSCEIFSSYFQRQGYDFAISRGVLSYVNRYVISLSIVVKTGINIKSCHTTAEFVTINGVKANFLVSEIPGYGGMSNDVKGGQFPISDLYYGLSTDNSDLAKIVKDIKLDLVEVIDRISGKIIGSIKNSYVKQLLKTEYNIVSNIRRELQTSDLPIPQEYIPTVISVTKSFPPVIGIDKANLKANLRYTYIAKISYSKEISKSSLYMINIDTGDDLLQRDITVYPSSGYAYSTLFKLSFDTVSGIQQADTVYSIYRSDCFNNPEAWYSSWNFTRISTNLKNINSFATILSPGFRDCSYQVKLKIIVSLAGKKQELYSTVYVLPTIESMMAKKIDILHNLNSSISKISIIQSLSILSQISLNNDKTNDESIILKVISLLTNFNPTHYLDAFDKDEISGFIQILVEILKSLVSSDFSIVSKEVTAIIINKLQMYCEFAIANNCTEEEVINTLLYGFSAVLSLRDYNVNIYSSDDSTNLLVGKSQIKQIVSSIYQLAELKLKGVIPGGHIYSSLTPNIGMSLISTNYMIGTAKDSNLTINNQNHSFVLIPSPNNLSLSFSIEQANQFYVLTAVLISITATPMNDIKTSTVIDNTSLRKNSLANGKVTADTMKHIYDDLKSTQKLNSFVNSQQVINPNLFFGVYLSHYDMTTGQTKIVTNASLSNIINEVTFGLTLSQFTANNPDSPRIPLYYHDTNGTWTNKGCYIDDQYISYINITKIPIIPLNIDKSSHQLVIIRCNWTNMSFINLQSNFLVQLTVDSFKDFKKLVLNYGYPSNFDDDKEFTKLKTTSYVILFGGTSFFIFLAALLFVFEKGQLKKACFESLFTYFDKRETLTSSRETIMGRISKFLSKIKNRGFYNTIIFNQLRTNSEPGIDIHRISEGEKDPQHTRKGVEESPGSNVIVESPNIFPQQTPTKLGLEQKDEEELHELYEKLKHEKNQSNGNYPNLNISPNLNQLLALFLEDQICVVKETLWGFIKSTHLLLSIIFATSVFCTRATRVLIFGSAFIGQLFLNSTFIDSNDSTLIQDDKSKFARVMFGSVFFSIGITIILKLVYQFFLKGKVPYIHMGKIEVDHIYSLNNSFYNIGIIIMIAWEGISIWRVVTCTSEFNDTAMTKWLYTFLCCSLFDIMLIDFVKVFLKLALNFACMYAAEGKGLLTVFWKNVAKAVSNFYFYFT